MCRKLNCWEFINCGREKGGIMVPYLGECPVPHEMKLDGLHDGIGAGRACWMVKETNCVMMKNKKNKSCFDCRFYKRVVYEEEENIIVNDISIIPVK